MVPSLQKQYNVLYKGKVGGTYTDKNGKTYNVKFEMQFKIAKTEEIKRITNSAGPIAESLVTINPSSSNTYSKNKILISIVF